MPQRICYDELGQYQFNLQFFPDGMLGWRQLLEAFSMIEGIDDLADGGGNPIQWIDAVLAEFRGLYSQRTENLGKRCPCVFISHRQCDKAEAIKAAKMAHDTGFDFWLDVVDLDWTTINVPFPLTPARQALLSAVIIELALLNCTHVLALMTKNVKGSMWVPYEFGRVKDSALVDLKAAGWFDSSWAKGTEPEYFWLAQRLHSEAATDTWLKKQHHVFTHHPPNCSCPSRPWPSRLDSI